MVYIIFYSAAKYIKLALQLITIFIEYFSVSGKVDNIKIVAYIFGVRLIHSISNNMIGLKQISESCVNVEQGEVSHRKRTPSKYAESIREFKKVRIR